jgi:hypothetical protein
MQFGKNNITEKHHLRSGYELLGSGGFGLANGRAGRDGGASLPALAFIDV